GGSSETGFPNSFYLTENGFGSTIDTCDASTGLKVNCNSTDGFISDISVKHIHAIAPAAYQSITEDWIGNPLEHSGSAKIPLQAVTAPVFVGDGVAYGTFDTPHVLIGDFEVECTIDISAIVPQQALLSSSPAGSLLYRTPTSWILYLDGDGPYSFQTITGTTGTLNLSRVGNQATLDINGVSETKTVPISDFKADIFADHPTADMGVEGIVSALTINGSTYSFTEGVWNQTALMVHDRSGNGNHINLVNISSSNWQLLERPDYPLFDGFSNRQNLVLQSNDLTLSPWADSIAGTGQTPIVTFGGGSSRLILDLDGGITTGDISQRRQSVSITTSINGVVSVMLRSFDQASSY
ncbi:MAG: hypothetical protein KAS32_15695, partial [Candidatus Peribacteraceae bacterium]|nr:hypothetical protein [Candidatus Peribacteraceae bacterium]